MTILGIFNGEIQLVPIDTLSDLSFIPIFFILINHKNHQNILKYIKNKIEKINLIQI